MIIKALEIWGIEGTFIFTWENVMRLIRENRESLKVILMAFVYDAFINWKKNKNINDSNKDKKDVDSNVDNYGE
jgi:phosphatidylinositol kinase/protein kinase (PI-3  family)